MKKVVGIISYLPDDPEIRSYRFKKLDQLLSKILFLFGLNIYIESQNWTDDEITKIISKSPTICVHYNEKPLGIVGARKALRTWFLKSEYDYLIMLDDDITVYGRDSYNYLKQIDENPGCFIENQGSRLQLFAISKELFKEVDFPDIRPENGDGFEDRIFVETLEQKFPDKKRQFTADIFEDGEATKDRYSTWWKNNDPKEMLAKTESIIAAINK